MANVLWFIIWLIILVIFSFWIAGLLAFFYIILYPLTVCIPAISVSLESRLSGRHMLNRFFSSPTASHRLPLEVHPVPENLRREHDGRQAFVLNNSSIYSKQHAFLKNSTNQAQKINFYKYDSYVMHDETKNYHKLF